MRDTAMWAFWRRLQYGTGFLIFWSLVLYVLYAVYIYTPPTCFDGKMNGAEQAIDCGGSCDRICAFTITPPKALWAQSFRIRDGQYNAVAYIENRNPAIYTPELTYTFSLYDADGLILETSGTTILPADSVYPIFVGPLQTKGRVPTQTFIELAPADMWLKGGTGRDQFIVQDRELLDVGSRPTLHANIYNSALTEARNIEVVATIFDAQGNALTASRTFVDRLPAQSESPTVFTWPEPIAKTLRSCEVPTDVILAIDLSGSMNNDSDNPPQPISDVLAAAQAFITRLNQKDQIGVVTFASDAITALPLGPNKLAAGSAVSALAIDPAEERGSTNTAAALDKVAEELFSARHNTDARSVAVLLTDGLATAPDENPEDAAIERSAVLKSLGVDIYAIGLGAQVNMDFVETLASDANKSYQAVSREQVDRIYREITGEICESGPAIIDIIPKTETIN